MALTVDYENPRTIGLPDLPALLELKSRRQWVAWAYIVKDNGKRTKLPINPHNGNSASSSNPDTWGTYDEAVQRARLRGLAGVGYVLTDQDGLTGADLDDCRDDDFGSLEPWAQRIID